MLWSDLEQTKGKLDGTLHIVAETRFGIILLSRHKVLGPYRKLFDSKHASSSDEEVPPHRYLFHSFVYQYHLLQFATLMVNMVGVWFNYLIVLYINRCNHSTS